MHPIAFRRRAKGLTQTELARQVGVSLNSVQLWEKGEGPRPRNIPKLAEALGVDGTTLLSEIEDWRAREEKTPPRGVLGGSGKRPFSVERERDARESTKKTWTGPSERDGK